MEKYAVSFLVLCVSVPYAEWRRVHLRMLQLPQLARAVHTWMSGHYLHEPLVYGSHGFVGWVLAFSAHSAFLGHSISWSVRVGGQCTGTAPM